MPEQGAQETFTTETDPLDKGLNRQHALAAMLACLLSLVMHAVLLHYLPNFSLDFAALSPDLKRTPRTKPIQLTEVQREAFAESPKLEMLLASDPALKADLSQQADDLGVPADESVIEPPPIEQEELAGELKNVAEPEAVPERATWEPRQEILAIEKEIVADRMTPLRRLVVPKITRVPRAPDVVASLSREDMERGMAAAVPEDVRKAPEQAKISRDAAAGARKEMPALVIGESGSRDGSELFTEDGSEITRLRAIEKYLTAEMTIYQRFRERKFAYFKIEVKRAGPELLPVIPKDIVLVQDCSASMAEQRLHFCRDGLLDCLAAIGPEDRFNVVGFREKSEPCFESWSRKTPETVAKAKAFIEGLRSGGNTDILTSVQDLLKLDRTPGRPVVAFLITDGRSTTGLTDSSTIIGEFSKLNDGAVSVFSMGTIQAANAYLLDLISYCNRGDAFVVTKGRWDIPTAMVERMEGIKRPVLSDVAIRFGQTSGVEAYPVQTSNLYLDRPLVIYGRFPRKSASIVFQAVGKAADTTCDLVFDIGLAGVPVSKDKSIREGWAKQKVYHLIGEYARKPDPETLKELTATGKAYGVPIPYRGQF